MAKPFLKLSFPSKTFLVGEYAALKGGTALVASTWPRFEAAFYPAEDRPAQSMDLAFPQQSPAERFVRQRVPLFSRFAVEFTDPHRGRGGFGASTAQFLAAYYLEHTLRSLLKNGITTDLNYHSLFKAYQDSLKISSDQVRPSGADLLGQTKGLISAVNSRVAQPHSSGWTMDNIEFCLLHTELKVQTHEHLKGLKLNSYEALCEIGELAASSFAIGDSHMFIKSVNDFNEELRKQGLVHKETQKLIFEAFQLQGVVATKGCGALGADVLMVLCKSSYLTEVVDWAKNKKGLSVVATTKDLSAGCFVENIEESRIFEYLKQGGISHLGD